LNETIKLQGECLIAIVVGMHLPTTTIVLPWNGNSNLLHARSL